MASAVLLLIVEWWVLLLLFCSRRYRLIWPLSRLVVFRCCSFFLLHSLCAIFFNILPNYYVIVTPFDCRPPHKTHKAGSAHVHSTPSTHVLHTCSSLHMYPRTYVLCPTHTPLRHSNLMQSFCAAVCCFYSYVAVFCFTLLLIRPLQYDSSLFPLNFARTFLVLL